MRIQPLKFGIIAALLWCSRVSGSVLYVDSNSTNPIPPYAGWSTAAIDIQSAVDVATNGDLVMVTDGIYATGGRVKFGSVTNRVVIDKPVTVQSVNGPAATSIQGYQMPGTTNGDSAVRCVYLASGATLMGFTLRDGATRSAGDFTTEDIGGGVWGEGGCTVSNCVFTGNSAITGGGAFQCLLNNCVLANGYANSGGGAQSCDLYNCIITNNYATQTGGGVSSCIDVNCTIVNNTAGQSAGGAAVCELDNCIAYFNNAPSNANYTLDTSSEPFTLNNTCTTPLPDSGSANLANDPMFVNLALGDLHLQSNSPCVNAGDNMFISDYWDFITLTTDFDGNPRVQDFVVDAGAYEFPIPAAIAGDFTNVSVGYTVNFNWDFAAGNVSGWTINFGDGTVVTNPATAAHNWTSPGDYVVTLTGVSDVYPGGVSATVTIHVVPGIYYVSLASTNPVPPYDSWDKAATNIQDAIDAVLQPTATILVTNGLYATGGRTVNGFALSNRVVVDKILSVQSVNGPEVTIIQGYQDPIATNSTSAIRCVYLTNGATLSGFTLTNGATLPAGPPGDSGDWYDEQSGGGVWCDTTNPVISNCIIVGNSAGDSGAGGINGTFVNCTFLNNFAFDAGGGVYNATLEHCTLNGNFGNYGGGGGFYPDWILNGSVVNDCRIVSNTTGYTGGGVWGGRLSHCVLSGNIATDQYFNKGEAYGGGAYGGPQALLDHCILTNNTANYGAGAQGEDLYNCIVANNESAIDGGGLQSCDAYNCTVVGNVAGGQGGGTDYSELDNCIVYFNTASSNANYSANYNLFNFSCTTPLPAGNNQNFSDDPQFADFANGDLHLQSNSPCINTGGNSYLTNNFDSVAITDDFDGNPRLQGVVVDVGAYEYPMPVGIMGSYTNVAVGYTVNFNWQFVAGNVSSWIIDFGDGTVVTNPITASHTWTASGDYTVTLTAFSDLYPSGISNTEVIHVAVGNYFVSLSNPNPVAPYTSWDTAATNIQDAVDVTFIGGTIWVSNGIYQAGSRTLDGSTTNRVTVTKQLALHGVNGPTATVIDGGSAVRCVYLTNGTSMDGFTFTNGTSSTSGGGVFGESTNIALSNCVFAGNTAPGGGGAYQVTLDHCLLIGNSASTGGGAQNSVLSHCTLANNVSGFGGGRGGGADACTLNDCVLTNNYGGGYGGGGASSSVLSNCFLSGNFGGSGGGGALGCTLTSCIISNNASAESGGGINGSTANNCVLWGNSNSGAYVSTLNSCALTENTGYSGGGASYCALNNCTLTLNTADTTGGGADNCSLNNCIVYYNSALTNENSSSCAFYNSCTIPMPDNGSNNIIAAPQLTDAFHIASTSPCIGAGNTNYAGVDIDGEPWLNPPSIGCDEFYADAVAGPLTVQLRANHTVMAVGLPVILTAGVSGRASTNLWDFNDGTTATNQLAAIHAWALPGNYAVVFTAFNDDFPDGVSATSMVSVVEQVVHYVSAASTNPVAPYLSWDTAATNIQDAVDAVYSAPKALVLVSNGVYSAVTVTGKSLVVQSVNGPLTTAVTGRHVGRCVYLGTNTLLDGFKLMNGAADNGGGVFCEAVSSVVTNCVITGNSVSGVGGGAFGGVFLNCVIASNSASGNGGGAFNSVLNGSAITRNSAGMNGGGVGACTLSDCSLTGNTANSGPFTSGGGADSSTLNNCVLTGNAASFQGGGMNGGTSVNSTFISNLVANFGGGAFGATMSHCSISGNSAGNTAGGASDCSLSECMISGNSSSGFFSGGIDGCNATNCLIAGNYCYDGGGATESTLVNCLVASNSVYFEGAGAILCTLDNCTVVRNSGVKGCGIESCTVNNTIVYDNFINYDGSVDNYSEYLNLYTNNTFSNSCTTPLPNGVGNFSNDPAFVDVTNGNFHLQANSPCINSGNNAYIATTNDLDGNPRIVGGTVDLGAFEFQSSGSVISYAWLQQYGLPTDGSVDYVDSDGTGMNNWQKWIAGLNPLEPASVLAMQTPHPSTNSPGVTVSWLSVSNRTYYIQRAGNLSVQPAFSTIQSNIAGQAGTTSFTDTTATNRGPYFYRVGVQ